MPQAIEITTFRLARGLTMKDFIAANADIDPWLKVQPASSRVTSASVTTALSSTCWSGSRPRRGTSPQTA